MAVSEIAEREIKSNPPPSTAVVLSAARDYVDRAGMIPQDLAHEIGYSPVTVRHFFAGTYEQIGATDLYVRNAVWQYIEQHPLAGDDDDLPKKLLPTADTRLLMARMVEAQERGRIIVVEGPPGTCKTTAMKWYWADHNKRREHNVFYLRAWSGIGGMPLLRELCRLTGAYSSGSRERLLRNAVRKLRRRACPSLLLVDECQYLLDNQAQPFEQLRDVLDTARCGCVLAGHFNFIRHLTNGMGRFLEQWLSRIDLHEHLRGLRAEEIAEIAREYLNEDLPADVRNQLIAFATARDRNAAHRSMLLPESAQKLPFRYLSIRRVRKFFERIEDLREIPANQGKPISALARAALKLLMQPEGKAL